MAGMVKEYRDEKCVARLHFPEFSNKKEEQEWFERFKAKTTKFMEEVERERAMKRKKESKGQTA